MILIVLGALSPVLGAMGYSTISQTQIACKLPHEASECLIIRGVLSSLPFIFGIIDAVQLHKIKSYNTV